MTLQDIKSFDSVVERIFEDAHKRIENELQKFVGSKVTFHKVWMHGDPVKVVSGFVESAYWESDENSEQGHAVFEVRARDPYRTDSVLVAVNANHVLSSD